MGDNLFTIQAQKDAKDLRRATRVLEGMGRERVLEYLSLNDGRSLIEAVARVHAMAQSFLKAASQTEPFTQLYMFAAESDVADKAKSLPALEPWRGDTVRGGTE